MNDARSLHRDRYGSSANVVVSSPGRINLIGEHTDYCGLAVLPMAIRQAIEVAASQRPEPGLEAISSLGAGVVTSDTDSVQPGWAKYVLAVLEQLRPLAPERGARLALDSDLPLTGGLSSSSALSVGCLFALNQVWELGLAPGHLVAMAVRAEQSAAIAGGAMDQTVITYGRPGHALRIDFDPPAHRHIPMPEGFTWMAGYSGTKAPKGESAAASYNAFVLTSRAAAVALGDRPYAVGGLMPQLSRVRGASVEEIASLPTMTVVEAALLTGGGDLGLLGNQLLDLRIAAEHVLSEAARVDAAEEALLEGDRATLGRLMDQSHASLARYGASTSSLDKLVAGARDAGAAGARLTGAGFGGWAIALTAPESADAVQTAMEAACGGPTFVATAEGGALWSLHEQ